MDRNEEVELDYEKIEVETNKAWLVVFEDDAVWLPKSQCLVDRSSSKVYVPRWVAEEKELV